MASLLSPPLNLPLNKAIAGDGELASGAEGQPGIGVFKDRVVPVGNPHFIVIDRSGRTAVEHDCYSVDVSRKSNTHKHCKIDLDEALGNGRAGCCLSLSLSPQMWGTMCFLLRYMQRGRCEESKEAVEKGLLIVPDAAGLMVYSIRSLDKLNPQIKIHGLVVKLLEEMMEQWYVPEIKAVLYELDTEEKQRVLLGHSEKLQ
ncbi:hypothetical protein SASPL_129083 [Salvia splendens]|uniref:Uncharacterized protein n=1 Tax=Salvia splendens TaxID=180675 RepID=A0A8X8XEE4_SALSN|nr:hypothetical protein SASPL_129083 [Salvia splendens]